MFKWFHEKMAFLRNLYFFRQIEESYLKFYKRLPQFHVGSLFITHFHVKKNVKLIFLRQNVFIFVSKRQLTKRRVRNFQVPLSRNLLLNPSKSKSNQKSEKLYTHNQIFYFAFLYPKFQNFCHQNSNLTFTHQNCSNQSCTSS